MTILYSFIFAMLLIFVCYQDFRYRTLSIIVLFFGGLLCFSNSIYVNGWNQALVFAGINLLLIGIQLAGIFIYFSIKQKKIVQIINTYLGSGDLWFYGIVACSFSPANFVIFNLITCLLILIVYTLISRYSLHQKTIPLAGCLALALLAVLISSHIFSFIKPYDDYFIFSHFYNT